MHRTCCPAVDWTLAAAEADTGGTSDAEAASGFLNGGIWLGSSAYPRLVVAQAKGSCRGAAASGRERSASALQAVLKLGRRDMVGSGFIFGSAAGGVGLTVVNRRSSR